MIGAFVRHMITAAPTAKKERPIRSHSASSPSAMISGSSRSRPTVSPTGSVSPYRPYPRSMPANTLRRISH